MDSYEATRVAFSRIQSLDPENASKIMGLLLIQDRGEKEMIRLAFGPESLLHSVILKAKKDLGLFSNNSYTPTTPPSPSPLSKQIALSMQNSSSPSSVSSRMLNVVTNLPSPLSIPNPSSSTVSSWGTSCFSDFQNPEDLGVGSSPSTKSSSAAPFYGGREADLMDDFHLQEQLSFLNDGSPPLGPQNFDLLYPDLTSCPTGNDILFPSYDAGAGDGNSGPHRRSCSVNDACLGGGEDSVGGFGWKPCLYFARGFCKNGAGCRFVHGGLFDSDGAAIVGSPSKVDVMEQCPELIRAKSFQQQRLAAASQLMATSPTFPYSNKSINFLLQQQQPLQADSPRANTAAAALMIGEDMNKLNRCRFNRNDFTLHGGGNGMVNPGSRQIYLTFPADSTFREEDVSNYFSIYGPVQDVRIPYQQKRMFGFVTFVYPETVKLILAKGNPHFVCDARVLVKPYKEKGKVPDKFRKQQQPHFERSELSACGSLTGFDLRDPYDLQLGTRMLYSGQDMWRRKMEEQADLQQAIELQNRRLMSLQLLDAKRSHHHRALSAGTAVPPPIHLPNFLSNSPFVRSDTGSPKLPEDDGSLSRVVTLVNVVPVEEQTAKGCEKEEEGKERESLDQLLANGNGKSSTHQEECGDLLESLEHNLPDSLFASPKSIGDCKTAFSIEASDEREKTEAVLAPSLANNNLIASALLPPTSTLDMASLKSCYFQVPRLASGHGAIGM